VGNACHGDTSGVDVDDLLLIAKMRVVLGMATLLTAMVDPGGLDKLHPAELQPLTLLVLCAYALQSIAILLHWQYGRAVRHPRLSHWLDVCWFTLFLTTTSPMAGVFALFFFAIATAAFRWGYDEGARVTLACTFLYLLSCVDNAQQAVVANVLLRAIVLLALGRMVSHWGEALLDNRRRIALLRDVSRLSNPRFGVDHTIASVLEFTRSFFGATTCVALIRDGEAGTWRLRSANGKGKTSLAGQHLDNEVAGLFSRAAPRSSAVYKAARRVSTLAWGESLHMRDEGTGRWQRAPVDAGRQLADLLGACSFICAPIPLRHGEGWVVVASPGRELRQEDAAFLAQVAAQAFPVIENIALLDSMASEARRQERMRFSNDLHDSTVQPYIGLSHALHALLREADQSPIAARIRQVAEMADSVVTDLRCFSQATRNAVPSSGSAFLQALRSQAVHFKTYHNLDIDLSGDDTLELNDRLGAEVVHLVREGISNIRRHTAASRAAIRLDRDDDWLHIRIENECPSGPPAPFTPRSISERAALLGGFAYVGNSGKGTAVHVEIPL
jgi:signal transduction histidine kinase